MMAIGAASIWLVSIAAWFLAGFWEWKLPWRWQEGLVAWGKEQKKFSKNVTVFWYIEDESELERRYWEMRRSLPKMEVQAGSYLWIEPIVFLKKYVKKPACYIRRFRDINLRFQAGGKEISRGGEP